jgi:hypothetical protein
VRMRPFLERVNGEERGVVALFVALSLVVFFGMTVLVVDVGALIVKHRGLVNANDAAAHAAAESFAINESLPVTQEGPAQEHAERLARKNVPDAEPDPEGWWSVIPGLTESGCAPTTCGTVTVKYQAGQSLFFAPVLGLGDRVTAHGAATAMWGPAGGAKPSPITIHNNWLQERVNGVGCYAPIPGGPIGTECTLWLDGRSGNGDDDGGVAEDSKWAWIDLHRWDIGSGGCPGNEPSDLPDWIAGSQVPQVTLNGQPNPTFVCTADGRPGKPKYFTVLEDQVSNFKVFPVNDTGGQVGDKYDIVGFTVLRIDEVIRGSDDGDAGDPHALCEPPFERHFSPDPPNNTFNLETEQGPDPCPLNGLHNPDDHDQLFPRITPAQGGQPFQGGLAPDCQNVDYCYSAASHVITWVAQSEEDTLVDWLYVIPPTPGECGVHELDPDAVCLVVSWQDYRTGGINPGVGVDFGLRAIRLSE